MLGEMKSNTMFSKELILEGADCQIFRIGGEYIAVEFDPTLDIDNNILDLRYLVRTTKDDPEMSYSGEYKFSISVQPEMIYFKEKACDPKTIDELKNEIRKTIVTAIKEIMDTNAIKEITDPEIKKQTFSEYAIQAIHYDNCMNAYLKIYPDKTNDDFDQWLYDFTKEEMLNVLLNDKF